MREGERERERERREHESRMRRVKNTAAQYSLRSQYKKVHICGTFKKWGTSIEK
jgi:hypothetical protein